MEFVKWPKIPRLHQEWELTEKIDGTNGVLFWTGDADGVDREKVLARVEVDGGPLYLSAGSRTRWLTPGQDNYGFAAWAADNAQDLACLGAGRHFGEWFGQGIQRGYNMDGRQLALFDQRWAGELLEDLDAGLCVVPVLQQVEGSLLNEAVRIALELLAEHGSVVAPSFMRPEGIVVRHLRQGSRFKVLLDNDQPEGISDVEC